MRISVLEGWALLAAAASTAGCGGGGGENQPQAVTITVSSASATAPVGSASPPLTVAVVRPPGDTNPVSLSVSATEAGVTPQVVQPGTGTSGTITATSSLALPGTIPVTVSATEGGQRRWRSFILIAVFAFATGNGQQKP